MLKPNLFSFGLAQSGLLLALLTGCLDDQVAGGTGVGNPPQGTVTFAMVAEEAAPAAKPGVAVQAAGGARGLLLVDQGGTAFSLTAAKAHVGEVKFKLPEGITCGPDIRQPCEADALKSKGPFVADLLAGTLSPAFTPFQAPVGAYRRIDLRLEALKVPVPAAPDLEGHSLVLSGTFAFEGRDDRPFVIYLQFNEETRFESGSMEVKEDSLNTFLLRLDARAWLAQANITACLENGGLALDGEGGLRIDKDNACEGLEKALKDGFKASGKLASEHHTVK